MILRDIKSLGFEVRMTGDDEHAILAALAAHRALGLPFSAGLRRMKLLRRGR